MAATDLKERRVAFTIPPTTAAEVDRIIKCTDLQKQTEVFRTALTLLRIHVDAAQNGMEVQLVDPTGEKDNLLIALPFTVTRESGG